MRDVQQRVESARSRADALRRAAGALPSRDGDYAYRQALREATMALREYRRVLHIFSGLVLEGKIPHEDEGLPVTTKVAMMRATSPASRFNSETQGSGSSVSFGLHSAMINDMARAAAILFGAMLIAIGMRPRILTSLMQELRKLQSVPLPMQIELPRSADLWLAVGGAVLVIGGVAA